MRQFATRGEVDAYLAAERIECLECGRRFAFLPVHLIRGHGLDPDEYRQRHGLPALTPLAGLSYRAAHAEKMRRLQANGSIDYSHLPRATAAAQDAPRPPKQPVDAQRQRDLLQRVRPERLQRLPPGVKNAQGRDMDRAREYRQARDALLRGDAALMNAYRQKWSVQ